MKISHNAVDINQFKELIFSSLPKQGAIEVQNDAPGKEHAWHQHQNDETIVVLKGSLKFYSEEGETICHPGTLISLPSGTRHGSIAQEQGAVYIIAFEFLPL